MTDGTPPGDPPGTPIRILLVEDTDSVRQTLTAVLESRGCLVTATGSAEEALDHARRERFDLLLTDVVLPGLSGAALAAEFRDLSPGVPVLFMSGYTDGAIGPQDLDTSRAYLQKPFSMHTLLERIHELLAWARARRTGRGTPE